MRPIETGGHDTGTWGSHRRVIAGWLLAAFAVEAAVTTADLAWEGPVLAAGLMIGPLLASIRLSARATAVAAVTGVALAAVLAVIGDDMGEQRAASSVIAAGGSLLAVWIAWLRGQREGAAARLAAQHAVVRVGAESTTLEEAGPRMLAGIGETLGWDVGALWEIRPGEDTTRRIAGWQRHGFDPAEFGNATSESRFARGVGLPGRVWQTGRPAWIIDVRNDRNFPRSRAAEAAGLRSAFAFPAIAGERVVGVLEFFSRRRRAPDRDLLEAMAAFGTSIGQYLESKRAEQAVRESDALKSAILASALDCIITMDAEGCIVEFNPAAERTFGRRREEVIGHEMAELIIPPALREAHRAGLARYLETGAGVVFDRRLELEGMRADGTTFPLELTITRIPGSVPALFTGYLRDITDRKLAEQQLLASRDRLDAILGNLADGVTVQDRRGRLVYANPAAARTLGFSSADELVRTPAAEVVERFEMYDEEGRPFPLERLPGRRALAGEEPGEVVVRFRLRTGGDERWSIVKATPLRDASGEIVRAVNIFEDVTAHKRAEASHRFLAESGRMLGASLDYETTLRNVAELAVPAYADWCAVDLVADDGTLGRVATAHVDPTKRQLARELHERWPSRPDAEIGAAAVVASGRAQLIPDIDAAALDAVARDEEHREVLESLGLRSAMIVPLASARGVAGAITFVHAESARRFDEEDLEVAEELGRRAATAIDNARLYRERAYIAKTLQQSLLPPLLPEVPGLEVAARYRAAGEGNDVGGDFYDVFDTGDGAWAVVIGDVCGKGADAAAITALARYTLRAAAMRERRPLRVLRMLNEALLRQRDDRQFCTALYASVEPDADGMRMRLSAAGHPLPLVVRADGRVETAGRPGTLLGVVGDPALEEGELRLGPGDALVMFTDGVTEARVGDDLFGTARLSAVASEAAGRRAGEIARRIEAAVAGGELRDDLALLVLRVTARPGPGGGDGENGAEPLVDLRLPASADAIQEARHALDELAEHVAHERLDELRLLVSELVTNGIRHGSPGSEDWIGVRVRPAGETVQVSVSDPGPGFRPGTPTPAEDRTGGWGLFLVEKLARRWGVRRGDRTEVWFEIDAGERAAAANEI